MTTYSGSGIGWFSLLLLVALGLVVLAAWAGSVAWVWRDAERRGQPGFIVAVLVALLCWPVSVGVWLLARPNGTATTSRRGRWVLATVVGVVGVLVMLVVGGFPVIRRFAKPTHSLQYSMSGRQGYLTVESEPPGATVMVRLTNPNDDNPLVARVGPELFVSRERSTLGMTPLEKFQLPATFTVTKSVERGWGRGTQYRSTEESCVYEVEVRKTLYHSTTFERVLVRPGQTTTLKAVLVKQYAGTVKYPDEQGGAK